jgi:hypothetical protein
LGIKEDDSLDASTSTSKLRPEGDATGLKPATLSFRDERVRLEWTRRRTPPRRKVKGISQRGEKEREIEMKIECERQASWGECVRQEGSGPAGLPKSVEEV